jgi:hypothetical protein
MTWLLHVNCGVAENADKSQRHVFWRLQRMASRPRHNKPEKDKTKSLYKGIVSKCPDSSY